MNPSKTVQPGVRLNKVEIDLPREYLVYEAEIHKLATAAQNGDKAGHKAFLLRLTPMFRAMVNKSWWGDNSSHEDIVQEILMAVHSKLHTYDPRLPIVPWVRAIAKYRIIDHLRHHLRKDAKVEPFSKNDVTFEPLDANNEFETIENRDFLAKAMQTLPKNYLSVVYLLKVQGLSVDEAATRLGMSQAAVKVTAHRAYKRLAKFASTQMGSNPAR